MRVVLVSEHASPSALIGGIDAGGQNIYVAQVARCLSNAGHKVEVLTRRDHPELPAVLALPCGTRVVHIDAGPPCFVPKERLLEHMPEFARRSEQYIVDSTRTQGRCDVVHANFFMSGLVAEHLKRELGIPFVITFHALGLVRVEHQKQADGFPAERAAIERMLVQRADQVIAECPQDRDDLTRLYDAPARKLSVIPCGFDASEFGPSDKADARRRLGIDAHAFVVLQLGRLVARKGIDNVIRAMGLLPADMAARLLVVGGNPTPAANGTPVDSAELQRLENVARESGVMHRVSFMGHRQRRDLRQCYAAADVFVTTPWYEPFGITPLEAMACGRAVIGSNVGGIKHSVVDGETGYLVTPRDPRTLAERLRRLHDDPALCEAMGQSGMLRARAHFTWEQVADKLLRVYERVRHVDQRHVVVDVMPALRFASADADANTDAVADAKAAA